MRRLAQQAIHELCLSLPATEAVISHGAPNYKARGKSFAIFVANHHGDGRIALWLAAPEGAQEQLCLAAPEHYFVPPYVGPRGWVGVQLNTGLDWQDVYARVREAWACVAPATLRRTLPKTTPIAAPNAGLQLKEIDPLRSKPAENAIQRLRALCCALPEVTETTQFGAPTWKAGKRSFVTLWAKDDQLNLQIWVGVEQQAIMTEDPRFHIPPYIGHQGWIALRLARSTNWNEVKSLVMQSYRHFALQRMLKQLDAQ
ncbi:MmcQ/YjbR family DNA-binding protein [Pseudomarimonas arenosa]|uniref:MmcQ/YjbR family DNA-binding protein n=1 Tax=Pseudomarimonas arenosa TaxID=2774145 RepID=A0AAW3ZSJ6_9GAMM|nr:MmcQ/YjbR family DNA-binding protein [Pseudomarimonas arenosa]MBD8527181.1 MmcQ/YjbR family DNA-binding protein [Pseudomarimonas arenosa]